MFKNNSNLYQQVGGLVIVWQDMAIFCPYCKILKVFGQFLNLYLVFVKILNLGWQYFMLLGIFIFLEKDK